jgi:hypothetical protein
MRLIYHRGRMMTPGVHYTETETGVKFNFNIEINDWLDSLTFPDNGGPPVRKSTGRIAALIARGDEVTTL